jgi:putative acetyltransferase
MLRELKEKDIDDVMKIWRDGNFKAHNFISSAYWSERYKKVQDEYLRKADTLVYDEDGNIKGFISIIDDGYIGALFVKEDSQREGIGRILINYIKDKYEKLYLKVYEKNINATMFFKAMGFKKIKSKIDESTSEKEYVMEWNKSDTEKVSVIYFDNTIPEELICNYSNDNILELNNVSFYSEKKSEYAKNIDIKKYIARGEEKSKIIDHIALIAAINSCFKHKNCILYVNYQNDYEILVNVIKDYVNVKKINLVVAIQKPFLIEGNKKARQLEIIEKQYNMFPIYKCNYDAKSIKLSFKEAFSKRDEEFMKEIKLIAENMLQKK